MKVFNKNCLFDANDNQNMNFFKACWFEWFFKESKKRANFGWLN